MQRRASTTPGAMMAPVGQASMHLVHWPQMPKGLGNFFGPAGFDLLV